jgi:hypothetical protein
MMIKLDCEVQCELTLEFSELPSGSCFSDSDAPSVDSVTPLPVRGLWLLKEKLCPYGFFLLNLFLCTDSPTDVSCPCCSWGRHNDAGIQVVCWISCFAAGTSSTDSSIFASQRTVSAKGLAFTLVQPTFSQRNSLSGATLQWWDDMVCLGL